MAERVILVCDVCGAPASGTVSFKVNGRSLQKDLCRVHLGELTAGARAPKRGRRAGLVAAPSPTAGARTKRTRNASTSKASTAKRRRRRSRQAPSEGAWPGQKARPGRGTS
jgi:hypothetical protein